MYCRNCGAQNPSETAFCGECGSKMEQEKSIQYEQQASMVQTPKWLIVIIIIALIVAALAIIGLIWGKDVFNKSDDVIKEPLKQVAVATATPTAEPIEVPAVIVTVEPTADLSEPVEEETLGQDDGGHEVEMSIMPSAGTADYEPEEVLQIRKWFQATEQDSSLIVNENNGVTTYHKGAALVKVKLAAGHQSSIYDERVANHLREYFYRDGQLYFAHIHNGKPTGDRFYYVNRQVLRYSPKEGTDYYNAEIAPHLGLAYSCRTEGETVFWENTAS